MSIIMEYLKIFFISIVNVYFVGLIDAFIKGNLMAYYTWERLPWIFKDANLIYPSLIFLVFLGSGFVFLRLFKLSKIYWLFLVIFGLFGLESLSYWFWIAVLNINQVRSWLPSNSFFAFYPPEAPWLNTFFPHLRFLSGGDSVTRTGLLSGVFLSLIINLILSICLFFSKINKK